MTPLNPLLYPAIFFRKSTRSYGDSAVPEGKLDALKTFIPGAVPLLPGKKAAFDIHPHKGAAMKIAAYAENDAASFINMAFMLQQMDLFLQANGVGALWSAMTRAAEKQRQGLAFGICLIFGMAKESPVRSDISQFNRKQPADIANEPGNPAIAAVRLAPSARNRQPWYLMCGKNTIGFYCKKGGFLDNTLLKGLNWFDMGIAICHAVLALQKEGLTPNASVKTDAPDKEGFTYCVSVQY
ncbi:MAG: hypothetical protein LBS19_11270 [Clostridiales bacterium]|jgi:hypothetical protein|nr:hypothetical protein [Clostridiales bacterium]